MRKCCFAALLFLPLMSWTDTGDSLRYLRPQDTIFLSVDAFEEKYFEHFIQPKQTLYSLARFYGLTIEELYYANPGLKDAALHPGTPIRIHVPNRAILRYPRGNFNPQEYAPVFYVVKRGDTMYRIAKNYFKMPMEDLMLRNDMADHTLKLGQCLHVGWLSIHGIPDSLRAIVGTPMARRNGALRKIYLMEASSKTEYQNQGVAVWDKDSKEETGLFALHRFAPPNSIIAITNPMGNVTVYAKVIGAIPETKYTNEVAAVLSPLTAKALGAIDGRFFVKIKYYR
jgi:LysM repeat protein